MKRWLIVVALVGLACVTPLENRLTDETCEQICRMNKANAYEFQIEGDMRVCRCFMTGEQPEDGIYL